MFLNICYLILTSSLLIIGYEMGYNIFYFIFMIVVIFHLFYVQLKKLKIESEVNCLKIFKSNNLVGLIIFVNLIIGKF